MDRETATSNLEPLRNYIRSHLARSLSAATPEDRLAAAWTVAAGRAMAARGTVTGYDPASATVRIRVAEAVWLEPLNALRSTLIRDIARISGLPITALHFYLDKRSKHDSQSLPPSAKAAAPER